MKWFLGLCVSLVLWSACNNDLVVTDEWKDIPIVWGFLSSSDTAHYIRVEKAFLDPSTSAYTIATIPDSLYYDDAVVSLKRVTTGQVYTLEKVDGNLEGYPRDSGIFASAPNYIYKIKAENINLKIGEDYVFQLQRAGEPELVTATTRILPQPVLRNPLPGAMLSFKTNVTFFFNWNEIKDAGVYDLHMIMHYQERKPETGPFYIPKEVDWVIQQNYTDKNYQMNGIDFYNAMAALIPVDPNAERIFDTVDIKLWCGGKEISDYIRITQANFGITSTQDIPTYTNISEGLGILTSRNLGNYTGFQVTSQTQDSIRMGSITKDLNFK